MDTLKELIKNSSPLELTAYFVYLFGFAILGATLLAFATKRRHYFRWRIRSEQAERCERWLLFTSAVLVVALQALVWTSHSRDVQSFLDIFATGLAIATIERCLINFFLKSSEGTPFPL
jgi:archaellum biogenesis protein FlaJ (TadC family)